MEVLIFLFHHFLHRKLVNLTFNFLFPVFCCVNLVALISQNCLLFLFLPQRWPTLFLSVESKKKKKNGLSQNKAKPKKFQRQKKSDDHRAWVIKQQNSIRLAGSLFWQHKKHQFTRTQPALINELNVRNLLQPPPRRRNTP